MPKVPGIKKRKLTPGGPKARRASSVPASETLPPVSADVVVDSAPVQTTGGSPTGALPRSKRKVPAHVQAAVDRALATSEGKEAPPVDTTGVDPALVHEFGAARPEAPDTAERITPPVVETTERALVTYAAPKGGRPPIYRAEFCEIAKQYCEAGATDYELADLFGVHVMTIGKWRREHLEFRLACVLGKDSADNEIERSFYMNAKGYYRKTQKVMQFQGVPFVVEHVEHVPGDVGAQKHWLANRKRDEWSNDPDRKPDDPLATVGAMTMIELARRMGTLLVAGMKAEAQTIEHDDGSAA